ncbi:hypothetical protein MIR68_012492 [Amoeboaphelidium protococcarum]|nr:hypothetical protein MIR68_012492 [Amoeboaphelidium protococcarum]
MLSSREENSKIINGVKVKFPDKFKPYPQQMVMMSKILRALTSSRNTALLDQNQMQQGNNVILESPTGTGKSMTLICSVLAWQEHCKAQIVENARRQASEACKQSEKQKSSAEQVNNQTTKRQHEIIKLKRQRTDDDELTHTSMNDEQPKTAELTPSQQQDMDDFADVKVSYKGIDARLKSSQLFHKENFDLDVNNAGEDDVLQSQQSQAEEVKVQSTQSPKVYIGTRTHKQISQMITQLRKTTYEPSIAILGSRNQFCVNDKVIKKAQKSNGGLNTACKDLLNDKGCKFFQRVHVLKARYDEETQLHTTLEGPVRQIYDIEDLSLLGRKHKGCPYFTSKLIAQDADVIFCPYNYIIDPNIRQSMEIQTDGNVFILDEAHNIEDACRSSASLQLSSAQLDELKKDLAALNEAKLLDGDNVEYLKQLSYVVDQIKDLVNSFHGQYTERDFNRKIKIWSPEEYVELFKSKGISHGSLPGLIKAFQCIKTWTAKNSSIQPLNGFTISTLASLFRIFECILPSDSNYDDDYSVVLIEDAAKGPASIPEVSPFSIAFWCQNSGVVFREIAEQAHSVILASGTLSPLDSFSSELQTDFSEVYEGSHVIDQGRAFVAVVEQFNNVRLVGTYSVVETLKYQDSVGSAVLECGKIICGGILLFMPSYSMLDKMISRWKDTGLYKRLSEQRQCFIEPKTQQEFETVLQKYQQSTMNGGQALLFGVFRGKLSEGIDFADDQARAVITVGIPFPNVSDVKVKLKRQYNDCKSKDSKVLNGNQWYEAQAYRAFNQAIGRCIRHKNDWGVILMLDARLSPQLNISSNGLLYDLAGYIMPLTINNQKLNCVLDFSSSYISVLDNDFCTVQRQQMNVSNLAYNCFNSTSISPIARANFSYCFDSECMFCNSSKLAVNITAGQNDFKKDYSAVVSSPVVLLGANLKFLYQMRNTTYTCRLGLSQPQYFRENPLYKLAAGNESSPFISLDLSPKQSSRNSTLTLGEASVGNTINSTIHWSDTRLNIYKCDPSYYIPIYKWSLCGQQLTQPDQSSVIARISTSEQCLVVPGWMFEKIMSILPGDCALNKTINSPICRGIVDSSLNISEPLMETAFSFTLKEDGGEPLVISLHTLSSLFYNTNISNSSVHNQVDYCISVDYSISSIQQSSVVIFGLRFLQNFFIQIDAQRNRIGFGNKLVQDLRIADDYTKSLCPQSQLKQLFSNYSKPIEREVDSSNVQNVGVCKSSNVVFFDNLIQFCDLKSPIKTITYLLFISMSALEIQNFLTYRKITKNVQFE